MARNTTAKGSGSVALSPRVKPVQERSIETVNKILEGAEQLLLEVGIDGFNTNLLAERADVRVRTIYRYFPNKFAVMCALAEKYSEFEMELLGKYLKQLAVPRSDWRKIYATAIRAHFKILLSRPGIVAIRKAMLALPEVRCELEAHNKNMAKSIADTIRARGSYESPEKLFVVGMIFCNTVDSVFDHIIINGDSTDRYMMIKELILMYQDYLSRYYD